MDLYMYLLPMMFLLVNGFLHLYYTYIFRGVFKADSAFFYFINAIILSYILFSAYEDADQMRTGFMLAILSLIIFVIIYFKVMATRITAYNGSVEETVQVIEEKLEEHAIPFEESESFLINEVVKFEINEGREYIKIKYNESWLNENYKYTITMSSKLKERGTLLEEIILDLRELRKNRTFKRRMIVDLLILIMSFALAIFLYLNP